MVRTINTNLLSKSYSLKPWHTLPSYSKPYCAVENLIMGMNDCSVTSASNLDIDH